MRNVGSRAEFSPYIRKKKTRTTILVTKASIWVDIKIIKPGENRTHSLKWSASCCRKEAPTYLRLSLLRLQDIQTIWDWEGGVPAGTMQLGAKTKVQFRHWGPHQLRLLLNEIFISYLDPPIAALFCTKYLGIVHAQILFKIF